MTALTRGQALSAAAQIRDETATGANTASRVGTLLSNLIDSTVFQGEAQTPPTAGDGLTGTNVFSVVADGTSLTVGPTGVKISDITGPAFLGRAANSSGSVVAIQGAANQVPRVSADGTTLAFGTVATAGLTDASVTMAKLANLAALTVIGNATNGVAVPAAIAAGTDGHVLRRSGTTLGFGTVPGTSITPNFGTQNLQTTGFVSIGSPAATIGDLRVKNDFVMAARDVTNTADAVLIQFPAGNSLVLGANAYLTILNGNSLSLRAGNVVCGTVDTSFWTFDSPALRFRKSVTAPSLTQENEVANSVNGQKTTIHAQNSTGTTTTGGAIDIGPGSGTTAGGLGRLLSGSSAVRLSWNDTGVSFFAATPVVQQTLTDNTGGTADTQLVDVGAVFSQANLNNNFASIRRVLNRYGLAA